MAKNQETAIDPFAVDLGAGQEMPPIEPLAKGWHKFFLTSYEMVDKPEESKRYLQLELQHDETGYTRPAFVNWPMSQDYHEVIMTQRGPRAGEPMLDAEGNELTKAGSKISVIRKVISAFGGPESGPITPDTFAQLIGNAAMFNVSVQEYPEGSGELRDRIDLAFGKGIRPC